MTESPGENWVEVTAGRPSDEEIAALTASWSRCGGVGPIRTLR